MEVKHMAKYRIRVEALDPAEELGAEYRMGIECEGFLIVADKEDSHDTAIHDMGTADIADCIANDADLMEAACIARGMFEAKNVARRFNETRVMSSLAERLAGLVGED